MATLQTPGFPRGSRDELELYLQWLGFLRGAVIRKVDGLDEEQARWRPNGRLISLIGIVNHLTHVEWRWIEGGMLGAPVERSEEEFAPGPDLTVTGAVLGYVERAARTDEVVRELGDPRTPCRWDAAGIEGSGDVAAAGDGGVAVEHVDLRWVLLHLVNETARHAGHADATRELLDGTTGE